MNIDNSQMKTFFECPWKWYEKYHLKIDRKYKTSDALAFGKRVHHLLECRLKRLRGDALVDVAPCAEPFEAEAQAMFAAYEARYPVEPFDVIGTEQYFEVPLLRAVCPICQEPLGETFRRGNGDFYLCFNCGDAGPNGCSLHTYVGKFDGIVRAHDTRMLNIFEHKTEKRGGKGNLPAAWAVRPQASLYIWAAEQLYGEPFDQILLDVLTRQSPAGREPCTFSRQNLQRSAEQKEDAVRNIIWVADQIEATLAQFGDGKWPFNGENCAPNNWKCEFHDLHIFGRDPFTLERDFGPAEEYLTL